MNILLGGFNLLIFIIIGGLYVFMPALLNKYLLFGVTINDEILTDQEITDVKKRYKLNVFIVWMVTMLIYLTLMFFLDEMMLTYSFVALLLIQIGATYAIFYSAHNKVKTIKSRYDVIESNVQTIETKEGMGFKVINSLWFLLYLIVIVGLLVLTVNKYPDLPSQIATHFDSNGVANGFAEKSYGSVMLMPIIMFLMTLMFMGINYAMKKAKKVSGVSKEKLSFEQENKFRYLWSVALFIIGLLLMGIFVVIQLSMIQVFSYSNKILFITLASTTLIMIIVIGLSIYTGQSGSRLKSVKKEKEIVDREDDSHWKGGLIYFNPKDTSLFVNKRFGVGMTLNFGNLISWIILIAIIGFVIFSLVSGK